MGRGRLIAALALASVGAAIGVGTSTAPANATEREVRAPERYSLENGLDVVLDPIPGRTTVAVVVAVDAGRRDQPDGWTGLAHLTEHLLFQGTPAAPGETITRLERLGASQINGETGNDFTRYYEVVPAARLEETLWLEAERFAHGLDGLDEAGVNAQRRVLDRERDVRTYGRAEVWDLVDEILYPEGHPYSRATEVASDVHAARLRDVRWFFQRYYAPDRLTLSISGGFDPAEVRPWIERYFGPLRRGGLAAPPAWTVQPEVDLEGERRVLAEASRSTDALYVIWPTPPWGSSADAALDFVSSHLERRLTERLVRDGDALSVDVSQGAAALANRFSVWITVPRRSGTLEPLQALDEELRALRRDGVDDDALRGLRRRWRHGELRSMDASLTRAQRHAYVLPAFPGGRYDLRSNLERYGAVTAPEVREAAVRYLHLRRRLVVSLSGRSDAPPEGRIVRDMMYEGDAQ